jgi:hypothetical protein
MRNKVYATLKNPIPEDLVFTVSRDRADGPSSGPPAYFGRRGGHAGRQGDGNADEPPRHGLLANSRHFVSMVV